MRWTVLSDNRRSDGSKLLTEHGLSILLDTEQHRILLDTGASDLFIRNAELLGIDLDTVDYVFISHGHNDHAGGLRYLLQQNNRTKVIVSPEAMVGHYYSKRHGLHSLTAEWPDVPKERLMAIDETCEVAPDIRVIARVPHVHPMPKGNEYLMVEDKQGNLIQDDFRHEIALYVDGLLFTGCAHSGLENILAACPWNVRTVVGGFHLFDNHESTEELVDLARRLMENYPDTRFFTSHCTGDNAFATMRAVMGDHLQRFGLKI